MRTSHITNRLLDVNAEILGEPSTQEELAYLHAVLAQCGLPYREPETRDHIRTNGRLSLVLSAGMALDPRTRKPTPVGLPYGAKPRLLLIHLCSEAIRRQSPRIEIEESMTAFMRSLGLKISGGKRGSIGQFKEQLKRLAAARMQFLVEFDTHATMLNPAPVISKFDLWFPDSPQQKILWPSEVTLSGEFFDTLKRHALPLDPRCVRALQHSARAMDIYMWLTHRLPRVRDTKGERVSWAALQSQFGPDIADLKNFQRKFLQSLRQVLAVYPRAKIDQVRGGFTLKKSSPSVPKLPR